MAENNRTVSTLNSWLRPTSYNTLSTLNGTLTSSTSPIGNIISEEAVARSRETVARYVEELQTRQADDLRVLPQILPLNGASYTDIYRDGAENTASNHQTQNRPSYHHNTLPTDTSGTITTSTGSASTIGNAIGTSNTFYDGTIPINPTLSERLRRETDTRIGEEISKYLYKDYYGASASKGKDEKESGVLEKLLSSLKDQIALLAIYREQCSKELRGDSQYLKKEISKIDEKKKSLEELRKLLVKHSELISHTFKEYGRVPKEVINQYSLINLRVSLIDSTAEDAYYDSYYPNLPSILLPIGNSKDKLLQRLKSVYVKLLRDSAEVRSHVMECLSPFVDTSRYTYRPEDLCAWSFSEKANFEYNPIPFTSHVVGGYDYLFFKPVLVLKKPDRSPFLSMDSSIIHFGDMKNE